VSEPVLYTFLTLHNEIFFTHIKRLEVAFYKQIQKGVERLCSLKSWLILL